MTDRNYRKTALRRHEQLKSCLLYDLTSVSFLFFFFFAFLLFRPRTETIYRMVVYTRAQQWRTKFVCQQATRSRIPVSAAILWDLSRSFHFFLREIQGHGVAAQYLQHRSPTWSSCSILRRFDAYDEKTGERVVDPLETTSVLHAANDLQYFSFVWLTILINENAGSVNYRNKQLLCSEKANNFGRGLSSVSSGDECSPVLTRKRSRVSAGGTESGSFVLASRITRNRALSRLELRTSIKRNDLRFNASSSGISSSLVKRAIRCSLTNSWYITFLL